LKNFKKWRNKVLRVEIINALSAVENTIERNDPNNESHTLIDKKKLRVQIIITVYQMSFQ
jgi:hypothetical protein